MRIDTDLIEEVAEEFGVAPSAMFRRIKNKMNMDNALLMYGYKLRMREDAVWSGKREQTDEQLKGKQKSGTLRPNNGT